MKLVHLSDTHLGYRGQGIEKMVEDPWRPGVPIRQREADLMLGLIRAVDRILSSRIPMLSCIVAISSILPARPLTCLTSQ